MQMINSDLEMEKLHKADAIIERIMGSWTVTKNRYKSVPIKVTQEQVSALSSMTLAQQQSFFEGL